jgi:hypothetical protein
MAQVFEAIAAEDWVRECDEVLTGRTEVEGRNLTPAEVRATVTELLPTDFSIGVAFLPPYDAATPASAPVNDGSTSADYRAPWPTFAAGRPSRDALLHCEKIGAEIARRGLDLDALAPKGMPASAYQAAMRGFDTAKKAA